jgi:hypothetical protein
MLSFTASRSGLIAMGLSAVFCPVLAVFWVIFGSEAADGAPFSSHVVLGTGVRSDLRRIMFEDRSYGAVLPQEKKCPKTIKSWHANRAPLLTTRGIIDKRSLPLTLYFSSR